MQQYLVIMPIADLSKIYIAAPIGLQNEYKNVTGFLQYAKKWSRGMPGNEANTQ